MQTNNHKYNFSLLNFIIPLYAVLTIWIIYWFETKFGYNFIKYGLRPRTLSGLKGILTSPFIHGDFKHLFNNSAPLFVLLAMLVYFYKKVALKVLIYGTLLLGLLTWIIGRDSIHIGASGVIYLLFGFNFFAGVFNKNYRLIAVSFTVVFLYGSMIWYIFPMEEKISWEGHLSGFISGILFAFIYRNIEKPIAKYDWEKPDYVKDEFDLRFDENGNYIPLEEIEVELETEIENDLDTNVTKYTYHFKPFNKKKE